MSHLVPPLITLVVFCGMLLFGSTSSAEVTGGAGSQPPAVSASDMEQLLLHRKTGVSPPGYGHGISSFKRWSIKIGMGRSFAGLGGFDNMAAHTYAGRPLQAISHYGWDTSLEFSYRVNSKFKFIGQIPIVVFYPSSAEPDAYVLVGGFYAGVGRYWKTSGVIDEYGLAATTGASFGFANLRLAGGPSANRPTPLAAISPGLELSTYISTAYPLSRLFRSWMRMVVEVGARVAYLGHMKAYGDVDIDGDGIIDLKKGEKFKYDNGETPSFDVSGLFVRTGFRFVF